MSGDNGLPTGIGNGRWAGIPTGRPACGQSDRHRERKCKSNPVHGWLTPDDPAGFPSEDLEEIGDRVIGR